MPRHNGVRHCFEDLAALGSNTNNYGELWGIGMALSLFLTHSQPHDTLHSLTDSTHASIAVTKHHRPKANCALVRAVRKLYHRALQDRHVHIEWVPAHVGIEGSRTRAPDNQAWAATYAPSNFWIAFKRADSLPNTPRPTRANSH